MNSNFSKMLKFVGDSNMPIEIKPLSDDKFLCVVETLTRIGYAKDNTLMQTCHLLHKQGRYYILHFKHLYMLDGKMDNTKYNEKDNERLKYITKLLQDWSLVEVYDKTRIIPDSEYLKDVKIVKHTHKANWKLESRFVSTYKEPNGNK